MRLFRPTARATDINQATPEKACQSFGQADKRRHK